MAARISRVDFVPELDLWLAEPPAQQHGPTVHLAGKIHEPEPAILQRDSKLLQLTLEAVVSGFQRAANQVITRSLSR